MIDFKNLRDSIKGLFGDNLTPEQAESIGKVYGTIDNMEKEIKVKDFPNLRTVYETLRTKYVELVKNTTIDKPINSDDNDKPTDKTLLDFLIEESNKRSK